MASHSMMLVVAVKVVDQMSSDDHAGSRVVFDRRVIIHSIMASVG